jgi:DNA sulfur modification protein DndC
VPPPWGGSHDALIKLYRDANGGECPVVLSQDDAPSCGTNSARFGCWTCTVVEKDRSLEGFVEVGFREFGPLLEFREWLLSIRNDPTRRSAQRRRGPSIAKNGKYIPGPFTLATRIEILDRLRALEKQVGMTLIADDEITQIHKIWAADLERKATSTINENR